MSEPNSCGNTNGDHIDNATVGATPDHHALRSRKSATVSPLLFPPSNSFLMGGQIHSATKGKQLPRKKPASSVMSSLPTGAAVSVASSLIGRKFQQPLRRQQGRQNRTFIIVLVSVLVGLFLLWCALIFNALFSSSSSKTSSAYYYGGKVIVDKLRKRKAGGGGGDIYKFIDPSLMAASARLQQISLAVEAARALQQERQKFDSRLKELSRSLLLQEETPVHFILPPLGEQTTKKNRKSTDTMQQKSDKKRNIKNQEEENESEGVTRYKQQLLNSNEVQKDYTPKDKSPRRMDGDKEGEEEKLQDSLDFKVEDISKRQLRKKEQRHEEGESYPTRKMTDILLEQHHNPAPAASAFHQPSSAGKPLPLTLANMDDHPFNLYSSCPSLDQLHEQQQELEHYQHSIQTTLVVQTSLDRAWLLQESCRRWSDPIVAILVLTHLESHQEYALYLHEWSNTCPQMRVLTFTLPNHAKPDDFPVNHLRNLGLQAVRTSHVLIADVDFIPSKLLNNDIRETLELRESIRQEQQKNLSLDANYEALVVPAFERVCKGNEECQAIHTRLKRDSAFLPRTFDELRDCVAMKYKEDTENTSKKCSVFQHDENWEGHSSTKSADWLAKKWYDEKSAIALPNGTVVHDIRFLPCFESLRYEPYVVIPWCPTDNASSTAKVRVTAQHYQEPPKSWGDKNNDPAKSVPKRRRRRRRPLSPYYDERFHGYGKNKIEYISHLRFLQYRFAILPRGFLVHNPHGMSQAKKAWQQSEDNPLHRDMDLLYPQFLQELAQKYFGQGFSWLRDYPNVVGLCPDTKQAIKNWEESRHRNKKTKKKSGSENGTGRSGMGDDEQVSEDGDSEDEKGGLR